MRLRLLVAVGAIAALLAIPAAASADRYSNERANIAREAAAAILIERAEASGALGVYYDATVDEYAVVLAEGDPRPAAGEFEGLGLAVRTETRDIDRATLELIKAELVALRPSMRDFVYSFVFDVRTGLLEVTSDAPRDTFATVEEAFPGRLSFRSGIVEPVAEGSWSNDVAPHWGGAWIQPNAGQPGLQCTSGWAMKTASGVRSMVTAGHCFPNGSQTNMGTAQRGSDAYPGIDVARVTGKTYQGFIYADGANGERRVNDGNNPVIGSSYCITGRSSGFKCGFVVQQGGITACYNPEGCTFNLFGARTSDNRVVQPGDSGGPFFIKGGNLTVGIRGITVARQNDVFGNWTSLIQGYRTIADFYVSTIVTN